MSRVRTPLWKLAGRLSLALFVTAISTCAANAAEPAPLPTIDELTAHIDDLYRSTSSHGTMTMKVKTRRYARSLTLEQWSLGKKMALVVIRKPAREAGNASLKTDDGLWSYVGRIDRLVRVPSGLLSDSWMGSHFTNDDLLRDSSYTDDFDVTIARASDQLVLTMIPKPDTAIVYTKLVYKVRASDWIPQEVAYYDGDRVVRTMRFDDIGPLGGRTVPRRMTLVPTDKPEESTIVTYDAMDFDTDVPRSLFTANGLKRAAKR